MAAGKPFWSTASLAKPRINLGDLLYQDASIHRVLPSETGTTW